MVVIHRRVHMAGSHRLMDLMPDPTRPRQTIPAIHLLQPTRIILRSAMTCRHTAHIHQLVRLAQKAGRQQKASSRSRCVLSISTTLLLRFRTSSRTQVTGLHGMKPLVRK